MWKEIERKSELHDFEKQATVEGLYTGKEENVGTKGNSTIYTLEENGEEIKFWGSTVLDNKFKELEKEYATGSAKVRVTFLGMQKGQSGTNYKDWKLEVWDKDTEVVHQDELGDDIPVFN